MRLNVTFSGTARRAWHARGLAVLAAATVPLLAACGALDPETNRAYDPGVGVNSREGSVFVLHTLAVANDHGEGTLIAALVNQETEDDTLNSVSAQDKEGNPLEVTVPSGGVDIPAQGAVQLADEGEISISGDGLQPGTFIDVRFSFASASPVDIKIPVVPHTGEFEDVPLDEASPHTHDEQEQE